MKNLQFAQSFDSKEELLAFADRLGERYGDQIIFGKGAK